MSLVLQDNELKQLQLAALHESQLGKQDIIKFSITSAISIAYILFIDKIIANSGISFREACKLMHGAAKLYDRKVQYLVSDSNDLFNGLSNVVLLNDLAYTSSKSTT